MTFFVKPGLPGIERIPGDRIDINFLKNKADYDAILELHLKNLDNDYIKPVYRQNFVFITADTVKNDLWFRFSANLWCGFNQKQFNQLFFIVRLKSGEIIGAIDVSGFWQMVELGIFIAKQYSQKNYGTEAIQIMIDFLRKNTDIIKLKWECDYDNMGSLKIAKKCGFIFSHNFEMYTDKIGSSFYLDLD